MTGKTFCRLAFAGALAVAAVPLVLAAGVVFNSPAGAVDTRRPVLWQTDEGRVDTGPLGIFIIIR